MRTTSSPSYDYAVFIGRFEPFHNAHQRVIEKALSLADKVIILIGSANKPRSVKNPFFVDERRVMIASSFASGEAARLLFGSLRDHPYNNDLWVRDVQSEVARLIVADKPVLNAPPRVCLVGHFKDASTDYLRMFPQWKLVEAPNHEQRNASDIRKLLYAAVANEADGRGKWLHIEASVPAPVHAFLREFVRTPACRHLVDEHTFLVAYREQYAQLPYPPVFVTVDAIVVHSGHLLVVRRGANPGKGLWALPGGFVGASERLIDACIRELREETRVKIPEPVLRGSIRSARVFDAPDRSQRGRTITHGYFFDFPSGELPAVKGGDDADKARWVPLSEFFDGMESQMYEDHFGIVESFVGA